MSASVPAPVLRSPHHLLAALPFLLGFPPHASLVLVWVDDGCIALTQRVDWPTSAGREPCALDAWAQAVVRAARHVPADSAIVVGVPEDLGDPRSAADPVRAICAQVQQLGLPVREALLSHEDSFWPLDPDFGDLASPAEVVDAQVAAEVAQDFRLSGWDHAASRDEVCAEFDGDADAQARVSRVGLAAIEHDSPEQHEQWRESAIALLMDFLHLGGRDARTLAACAIGLRDIRVRDCVLWHLAREQQIGTCLQRLRLLVRALPSGQRAPAATAAAICAWLMGDGVRAGAALEIAARDEPDYGLAQLVGAALANGLPPQAWAQTMGELSYQACRHGLS